MKLQPENAGFLQLRGVANHGRKRYDAAIADLTEALRRKPDVPYVLTLRGQCYVSRNDEPHALADFKAAAQLDPKNRESRIGLAAILAASDNPDLRNGQQALDYAQQACDLTGGKDPRSLAVRASAEAGLGDFDRAIATIEAALQLPDHDPAGRTYLESMLRSCREHQPIRFRDLR